MSQRQTNVLWLCIREDKQFATTINNIIPSWIYLILATETAQL